MRDPETPALDYELRSVTIRAEPLRELECPYRSGHAS
jgi:hypothetical protein